MTNFKVAVGALVVAAGLGTALIPQNQAQYKLREQNNRLQQQIAAAERLEAEKQHTARMPRLPAPPMAAVAPAPETPPDELRPTNLLGRLFKGEEFRLGREQVEPYLQQNHRSAESLVAAFRSTQDVKLLREALEKYPGDPRVNYAAYFAASCNGNLKDEFPPEEQRRMLDAFKQSAPDNALADYLSAENHFAAGQADSAVRELLAAAGKPKFQDYSADFVQNAEEAYRAAGYSETDAKAVAALGLVLPDLAASKRLTQDLVQLSNSYHQAGDDESARAALQMGLGLGQRFAEGSGTLPTTIQEIVSLKIQEIALGAMDPAGTYDSSGQTVKDRLAEIARRLELVSELGKQENALLPTLQQPELISFFDRMKLSGEMAAFQWVMNRQGQP